MTVVFRVLQTGSVKTDRGADDRVFTSVRPVFRGSDDDMRPDQFVHDAPEILIRFDGVL